MIQKESWHREIASFEKEREILYRQYAEGQISAEEFANRMLRFWKIDKGEAGLLDGGKVTPEWLYAHSAFFVEKEKLEERWKNLVYDNSNNIGDSPRFISEVLVGADVLGMQEVALAVFFLRMDPPSIGARIGDYIKSFESPFSSPGSYGPDKITEKQAEASIASAMKNAKTVVEAAEAFNALPEGEQVRRIQENRRNNPTIRRVSPSGE